MDSLCQGDTRQSATETAAENALVTPPLRIMGFNGTIKKGLIVHPDDKHLVYAMGRFIIIEEMSLKILGKQRVLASHSGHVTSLAVSTDGHLIASSQESETGQKASVLLWDFANGKLVMEKPMHKVRVCDLAFTFSNKFLLSLGCQDDGNLVIWSSRYREPLCGHPAQSLNASVTLCLATSKINDCIFATAGDCHGRIWRFDPETKRFTHTALNFASSRRVVVSMVISDFDNKELPLLLCGTTSGDVLTFHLITGNIQCAVKCIPPANGITSLRYLKLNDVNTFDLLLGTGNGELRHYDLRMTLGKDGRYHGKLSNSGNTDRPWKHTHDASAITSIAKVGHGESICVATHNGHMYRVNVASWNVELVHAASSTPIETMTFARDTDDLLILGEFEKVRIINTAIFLEVRRYVRTNRLCQAVAVNHDGTCVFSGWDCGSVIVLGFGSKALEMKELYRIAAVQTQAITCLALTSANDMLVSGGKCGQTRVWKLSDDVDTSGKRLRQGLLVHLLAAQAGAITAIAMAKSQQTFASSSEDGSVAIYDIASGCRIHVFKVDFCLTSVRYMNDDLHIVAGGYDGNLHFWEIMTSEYFRALKASDVGPVHGVDVSKCNKFGVSVGKDELIKFWNLEMGTVTHVGSGHGDVITTVKYGPRGSIIVTGAKNGSVCIWRNPNLCPL